MSANFAAQASQTRARFPHHQDELSRGHANRCRILAIMRLAHKVLGMKRRSIGRLGGGGAAVTALLVSMGLGATGAQAQYAAGGTTTATSGGTTTNNAAGAIAIGGGVGNNAIIGALGTSSIVIGDTAALTNATGQGPVGATPGQSLANSVVIGPNALGQSNDQVIIGNGAQGLSLSKVQAGIGQTAIGAGAITNYEFSTAIGNLAQAINNQSVALGYKAQALNGSVFNAGNIAIGAGALSQGDGSDGVNLASAIAIGSYAAAKADGGIALGEGATSNFHYSTAVGSYSTASGLGAVALGGAANASATGAVAIGGATNATGALTGFATASGANSVAIGTTAQATKQSAIAAGDFARAFGVSSAAYGNNAVANKDYSIAIGQNAVTKGDSAVAIGSGALASAQGSTVLGTNATASGLGSVATGFSASATANYATATGDQAVASGTNSAAYGLFATASGASSLALGDSAKATNTNDVALGSNSVTSAPHTGAYTVNGGSAAGSASSVVSVGKAGSERQITNVAPGVVSATSTDAINGSQLFTTATAVNNLGTGMAAALGGKAAVAADGTVTAPSYTIGGSKYNNVGNALSAIDTSISGSGIKYFRVDSTNTDSIAVGSESIAIGGKANAQANVATAIGFNAQATADNASAYGSNTIASGVGSSAVGTGATATGLNASAFGISSNASGANSIAAGGGTASAASAIAIGQGAKAYIDPAIMPAKAPTTTGIVAIGRNATASFNGAVAIGDGAKATNDPATAVGSGAVASGTNASAYGNAANAVGSSSVAAGDTANAYNTGTIAIGSNAVAGLAGSTLPITADVAIGSGAVATGGEGSFAAGSSSRATGLGAVAVGFASVAPGTYSTSVGYGAGAGSSGAANTAIGHAALSGGSGQSIVAVGNGAAGGGMTGDSVVAIGSSALLSSKGDQNVGIGDSVLQNGTGSYNIGVGYHALVGATGNSNTAIGEAADFNISASYTTAIGKYSIAYGNNGVAVGISATAGAVGITNDTAVGPYAKATGGNSFAGGAFSQALAASTVALGDTNTVQAAAGTGSIAAGHNSKVVSGTGAVALGESQTATGNGAVAIGDPNTATGTGAVAIGANNTANGQGAVALGNSNSATGQGSLAIGSTSTAKAAGGVALGDTAVANNANDVALGSKSTTAAAVGTANTTINGTTYTFAGAAPGSTVSVGAAGAERTITNVAAGRISGTSTDAINGSQLFATNAAITAVGTTVTNLGTTAATNFGGGVTYDPLTGKLTAPSYSVAGSPQTSVGAAIAALQTAAPVQYSTAGAPTTPNGLVPSNNMTLVGKVAGGVVLDNVAPGSTAVASTQAINGGQLNTGLSSVATNIGGGSTYNPATGIVTPPSITVGGKFYTDLTSAIQAAGGGFNLTTAQTGSGVANGTSVQAIAAGSTATVTAGNNVITTQKGANVEVAVNPALTGMTSIGVTGGPTINGSGITMSAGNTLDMGGNKITNLAAGSTAAGSTNAVNGGQLNTGLASVATNLGGGAKYDPTTGAVLPPSYTIGGTTFNNVGSALGAANTAVTSLTNGTLGLVQQVGGAPGNGQIVVGSTTGGTSVSFTGTAGNRVLTGVAAGALAATSTDAVNGSQLFATNTTISAVGTTTASALGGGATYDPLTGKISAPSYSVGGTPQTSVGAAIAALQTGAPVQYSTSGAPTTPNGLIPSNNMTLVGKVAGGVVLDNVAPGSTVAGSTQAVDGGQLNKALASVATNFGGASKYDPVTGIVTPPAYTIAGTTYTDVGSALGALANGGAKAKYFNANSTKADSQATGNDSVAVGPLASAAGNGAIAQGLGTSAAGNVATALGSGASASGNGSTALGTGAVANNTNDVALGSNSVTAAPNTGAYTINGGTAAGNATSVVSVGSKGSERQITNVAPGVLSATSTDAINGSQLYIVGNAVNAVGTTAAANFGGGATYDPLTGKISAPSYTVGTSKLADVGAAIAALQTGAPVQYTTVAGSTTPNGLVPSQSMTLVGKAAGPVTLSNLAPGTLSGTSTDAVNGSQLYATNQNVTALTNGTAGLVQQTGGAPGSGNLTVGAATGGTTVDFTGTSGARVLAGVAPGSTVAGSTQAINGGQLNTGLASVATNLGGSSKYDPVTGIVTPPSYAIAGTTYNDVGSALGALANGGAKSKYFNANSTLADSTATGVNSIAIGPLAVSKAANGVSIGNGAIATNANDVALGSGSVTGGPDKGAYTVNGGTAAATAPTSVVSVGAAGAERQITNVAAGVVSATSTDAVNGSQLFIVGNAVNAVGTTAAAALGGGATYDPLTGKISAPSYTVGSNKLGDVGAAIAALQSGAPVQYSTAGAPTTPNGLIASNNMTLVGKVAGGVVLDNVAPGSTAAGSTQAINGGQLNTGLASVATNLGGSSKYDPTTGIVTPPSYTIAGNTYNDVGSALGALANGGAKSKYFNTNSTLADSSATGTNSVAIGPQAVSKAANGVSLGNGAIATNANDVALGSGSVTAAPSAGATTINGGTVAGTATSVVSVGAAGAERQITNVAPGAVSATSTDATNGSQLYIVGNAVNQVGTTAAADFGGGATYDPLTGKISAPSYKVGGQTYTDVGSALAAGGNLAVQYTPDAKGNPTGVVNLAGNKALPAGTTSVALTGVSPGSITAGSTDAINGSQIAANQASVASALGGGSKVNPDGTVSAPSYAVAGINYSNVGGAISALGHTSVQNATDGKGNTLSQINLASDQGGPVVIHNLAPGVAATDAANVGQVNAVAAVANNSVQYDKNPDGSKANSVTFGGTGATAPVVLQNVAAGVKATDAVNLAQLQGSAATTLASANAYTDSRVNNLAAFATQGINDAKRLAISGTALALAASGLRYDDRAGKLSVAGATSFYHSTQGLAFGIGYTSKDLGARFNLSVNGTPWASKPEVGVVVGASFTLN